MSRRAVSSVVIAILLAGILTVAFNVQPVKSDYVWTETIYIRADGGIQPSMAPISSVDGVTYTLTDNIVGNVTGGSSAIIILRDNIIIDGAGHTLTGTQAPLYSGASKGIYSTGRSNVTIENMIITTFSYGIEFDFSSGNSVSGNNITANKDGGILLYYSFDNSVGGNNITNNGDGLDLYSSSSYNSVSGNNIAANYNDGVHLYSSSNNNSVSGNNITANNIYGISLDSSNNNSVSGNNIANNGHGMALGSSSDNSVSGNNITASEYEGIWLDTSSNNNSVSGNNITARNLVGIYLSALSNNNSVSANNIANNLYGGIFFDSSSNNSIVGNNIANDSEGIYLEDSSGDNSIFHNNFVNNTRQVVSSVGFANVWDDGYPSGGNYWSDYNGTDSNGDGIGDTAYVIDANNTDHFPLMGMFYDFNVFWIAPGFNVELISDSSVSAFDVGFWIEHPEDPNTRIIQFSVTGEAGTAGFCRICIPTALLNASYTVLLNGTEISCTLLPFSNSTHSYLYFNYTHSTEEVIITPEFPSLLILPILMIMTLLAIVASRKKWPKHHHEES
ncbi:MAG: NosD domain-containing protein [Candidatus Bathyarchaeia archaeon]